MIIEDDADTRDAMSQLLTGAGYRVIASDEGRKALELAEATRPSVVVLDLVTSGMNGWEFLEHKGEIAALSGVPIVVVTGSASAPPRSATAVLRKPVEAGKLLATIRGLLVRPDASPRA
jgi:CheY-like chemotaxis protein